MTISATAQFPVPRGVMRAVAILGILGLGAATSLFFAEGASAITATFAAAGLGVVWAALFHFVSMTMNGRAWEVLLPPQKARTWSFFIWAVWLRETVNTLLPVARIGGEVASLQALLQRGIRAPRAVGTMIVDVTISLASQCVFTIVGVLLLVSERGSDETGVLRTLIGGLVVAVVLGGVFLYVQRRGFFGLLARIAQAMFGERFSGLVGGAKPLDRSIRALYLRRPALVSCFFWQLAGWFAGAGELAIALHFLGEPPGVTHAIILEGAIQALASVAFLIPGALGVQEGAFLAVGTLIGLTPETALALALCRRARDVIVYAPALIVWQVMFGRWLWKRAGAQPIAPAAR